MSEVNEAMTEPEAEAHGSDNAPAVSPLGVPPLELQPVAAHAPAARYQLAEFVRYHDRAFVAHAYAALCRRAPTAAELAHTLDDLRAGRRSKIEIIESLCVDAPAVQVVGLPSPMLRRIDRWPVVGYVLRLLRAVVHLPVSLQQQQQFEIYALAQQQRIADYLNQAFAELAARSVELATRTTELTTRTTELAEHAADSTARAAELATRAAAMQAELERFQEQQRQVQTQLHADIVGLSGQREFLMQEQRVIVETQRVVLGELQAQLHELAAQQAQQHAELTAQVRRLQTPLAAPTTDEPPPASARTDEGAATPERGQA